MRMRAPKFNVVNKHKTTIKVSLILPDIFDLPCDVMRVTVGKNFQLRKSISLARTAYRKPSRASCLDRLAKRPHGVAERAVRCSRVEAA